MEILLYPAEVLRLKAVPVTAFGSDLKAFADELTSTMTAGRGIGLAAPQVGSSTCVFVAQGDEGPPVVFINPEIIATSLETLPYEEGCLSIPGLYEEVVRPAEVEVQAYNVKGRPFKKVCSGLWARVVQHEIDHLKGVLFIDHLSEMKRERLLKQFSKNQKK